MKKTFITLIILFSVNGLINAQNKSAPLSEMYLTGKWNAVCPIEVVDKATLRHCELCDFQINSNNPGRASLHDFEMDFQADKIIMKHGDKTSTVPYTRNPDNHSISFAFGNNKYHFRVFMNDDYRILVNHDGMLLYLTKAE